MEFQVFNRQTEKGVVTRQMRLTIDVNNYRIRFNAPAMSNMGIEKGSYVHFLKFEKNWFIALGPAESGFKVQISTKRAGAAINATKSGRMILQALVPGKDKWEFYLQETAHEWKSNKVYELVPVPKY